MGADELCRSLEAEMASALHGTSAGKNQLIVSGPTAIGRHAAVYQAKAQDSSARFAVKVYLGQDMQYEPVTMARRQFTALEKARHALGPAGETQLPKPFAVLEANGALVVEWIEGRSMLALMRQGWVGIDAYMALSERAGQWLRKLHDAGGPSLIGMDGSAMADEARTELSRCTSPSSVEWLHGALGAAAPLIASAKHTSSWAHGDFKSSNLMVRDQALVGIDVDLGGRGPVLFDVVAFLNDLSVNLRFPGMLRLLPFEDKLEQSFLRGYRSADSISELSLRFVQLCALASVWSGEVLRAPEGIRARFSSRSFLALARRVGERLKGVLESEQQGALRGA